MGEAARHRRVRPGRRRARRAHDGGVRALLSLGLVAAVGASGTLAYWTDSVTVSGTTLSAGTLDLRVNGSDTVTGFTTMNIATLVPGNTTAAVLTVTNNGTAPLRYSLDAAATNADGKGLGAALTVKITADAATTGSSPSVTCAGSALAGSGSAFAADLVPAASPRQLAAGASETLCVQATLPSNAASSLQGATTDVTFTATGRSF